MKLFELRDDVKKKTPEAPFEKGSATEVAAWLKKHHESVKDALAALSEYRSNAGKLSDSMKAKLDHIKALLHAKDADERRKTKEEPKKEVKESVSSTPYNWSASKNKSPQLKKLVIAIEKDGRFDIEYGKKSDDWDVCVVTVKEKSKAKEGEELGKITGFKEAGDIEVEEPIFDFQQSESESTDRVCLYITKL